MNTPPPTRAPAFGVRLHGRGGQGVVTSAELLAVAGFLDGHETQAFPSFGSERMGAPVMSFCRIADSPIRLREPVDNPDAVVIADATLLHHVDVFAGLAPDGHVIVNSALTPQQLGLSELLDQLPQGHLVCVAASDLAREHTGRPVASVCLLGAFAARTRTVSLASIEHAVQERFKPEVAAKNIAAARAAYAVVDELCHA